MIGAQLIGLRTGYRIRGSACVSRRGWEGATVIRWRAFSIDDVCLFEYSISRWEKHPNEFSTCIMWNARANVCARVLIRELELFQGWYKLAINIMKISTPIVEWLVYRVIVVVAWFCDITIAAHLSYGGLLLCAVLVVEALPHIASVKACFVIWSAAALADDTNCINCELPTHRYSY